MPATGAAVLLMLGSLVACAALGLVSVEGTYEVGFTAVDDICGITPRSSEIWEVTRAERPHTEPFHEHGLEGGSDRSGRAAVDLAAASPLFVKRPDGTDPLVNRREGSRVLVYTRTQDDSCTSQVEFIIPLTLDGASLSGTATAIRRPFCDPTHQRTCTASYRVEGHRL